MAIELVADDLADLPGPDHFPHLFHAGPLDAVSLTGEQDDLGQRGGALDAVEIIVGTPVPVGADELKLLFLRADARLFVKLPGDGLTAVFSGLGGAAGIFPGAGKALALGPAGQQHPAATVINPNADYKTEFAIFPGGAPLVNTTR